MRKKCLASSVVGLAALSAFSGVSPAVKAAIVTPSNNQVLFAFGEAAVKDLSGRYWNGNTSGAGNTQGTGFSNLALNTATNVSSGLTLSESTFDTINVGGVGASGPAFTVPTGQALALGYQQSGGGWINPNNDYAGRGAFSGFAADPVITLTLGGLSLTNTYSLTFFAARGGVADNRDTMFNVSGGAATTSMVLAAGNNDQFGNVVTATGVTPNSSGIITVNVSDGPLNTTNNSGASLYYLSTLDVVSSPVPEPTSIAIGTAAAAFMLCRRGRRRIESQHQTSAS